MLPPATRPRILMVEDTVSLAETYKEFLRAEPYDIIHVETGGAGLAFLENNLPDAILLDLILPDMDGIEILRRVAERKMPIAVVVATAHGSINVAVEAMRLGAADFLVKPFNADRLVITLRNVLERQRLTRIVDIYRNEIDRREFGRFVGSSLAMQAAYRIIESAAASKATVFITGESGTGKELCAEAVHQHSPRAGRPFIVLNCGAIPKDLMESELFGHVRGAFTGAIADRVGAAELADGGTLFLDEICELEPAMQTKLLRFAQTETFQKVGSNRPQRVDVRIVCATNRDPLKEVREERFREDLYYRLHVIPIVMPSLRERIDDVPAIARKFLADFSARERKSFKTFAPEAEAVLVSYDWPGNVRQLQNVIHNIVVLNEGDTVLPSMLPAPLNGVAAGAVSAAAGGAAKTEQPGTEARVKGIRPLAEMEREAIEQAIASCGGNIPKAAALLGVSASTIYRKREAWMGAR